MSFVKNLRFDNEISLLLDHFYGSILQTLKPASPNVLIVFKTYFEHCHILQYFTVIFQKHLDTSDSGKVRPYCRDVKRSVSDRVSIYPLQRRYDGGGSFQSFNQRHRGNRRQYNNQKYDFKPNVK